MVDLNGQYRKIRWQVNREIKKVIKSSSSLPPSFKYLEVKIKSLSFIKFNNSFESPGSTTASLLFF